MDRAELRLELLKLTYNHSHGPIEAIGRARKLEEFLFESGGQVAKSEAPVSSPKETSAYKGKSR